MWVWFHKLGSSPTFYRLSGKVHPWLWILTALFLLPGLYGGLVWAPPDYQQGEAFRIIYVHVPSAWMSMFVYTSLAVAGAIVIIWRIKLAEVYLSAAAPIGAAFTVLALVTGMLWGKPMWGAYWVWDARLTSELILLFLYLGIMALESAIRDDRQAARVCAILALVGVINIPIIHYSVEWWSTLHQGPTVTKFDKPSIDTRMLLPLLAMAAAFQFYFFALVLIRMRTRLLQRERYSRWVRELAL